MVFLGQSRGIVQVALRGGKTWLRWRWLEIVAGAVVDSRDDACCLTGEAIDLMCTQEEALSICSNLGNQSEADE